MRTTALVIIFIGILAVPATAAGAQPSDADLLGSAEPPVDAVVVESPASLRLEFTEGVVPGTARIRLFTSDGESVGGVGPVTAAGSVVEAPLERLPEGRYLVAWDVETETAGVAGGGYFFTIDRTGLGAIEVDRGIEDAGGGRGLRGMASVAAFLAGSLMIATLAATAIDPGSGAVRVTAAAAAVTAGSAALALAGAVIAPAGALGDVTDPAAWGSALGTASGRGWVAAIAGAGAVPLLIVLRRDDPGIPRRLGWRIGAVAIGVVVLAGVSIGIGAGVAVGPGVVALAFMVATGGAIAWILDQRVIAIFAAAGVATVIFVGAFLTRPAGHSATLEGEALALEVDIGPARQGVNEVHLYAFHMAGGLAPLADSEAWITHLATNAGPIRVPLVRAGPNHFLTYTADLPLAGEWKVEFIAAGEDGETAHLDTIVNAR